MAWIPIFFPSAQRKVPASVTLAIVQAKSAVLALVEMKNAAAKVVTKVRPLGAMAARRGWGRG
jgi:hypothetical protein